jgi:hypothetical protein
VTVVWFLLLVYAFARTTVWLQDWAARRSLEFDRDQRDLAKTWSAELKRYRGEQGPWL